MIPDIDDCISLMESTGMLENIRDHSFVVANVASLLLDNLDLPADDTIAPPDKNLVIAGALLHDIAKTACLGTSRKHAEEGKLLCSQLGYHEVAEIVGEHVILQDFEPTRQKKGHFSPKELVYYSDKRVTHDRIATLEQRLDYIIERYGDGTSFIENRIRENFARCQELERNLFRYLPFAPGDLEKRLQSFETPLVTVG